MNVTELPAARPSWADDLREYLGRTPIPVCDLGELLLLEHDVSSIELERELRASGDVYETEAGWVSLVAAADGVVLTHVVSEGEREHGVLIADGDLDLWARLADEGLPLSGGGEVRTRWTGDGDALPPGVGAWVVGPDGWLDPYEAGQMLALRLRDGSLSVEPLDDIEPEAGTRERCDRVAQHCGKAAAAAVSTYLDDEGDLCWARLNDAIASLVVADSDVLAAPLPPLGMLLESAGLQAVGGFVALPGVPGLAEADEFEPAEVGGLVLAHMMLAELADGELDDAKYRRQLLAVLTIPVVADRIVDAIESTPLPEETLEALLGAATTDEHRGLALLLAARSAESRAEFGVAEQRIEEAARLAPASWRVARDAAQYAAAKGDVVRADAVLRSAGCPDDDPLRLAMKPLLKVPNGVVSRNRSCPCGSGRKYKVCCLRKVAHPLPVRAGLAYARLVDHAERADLFGEIAGLACLVEPPALSLALDLALFDGDVAEDYLDRRGHLLANDERELVESWIATRAAPYEVIDVQVRRAVTLRPLLGGEPVVLHDRLFATCVSPLDVLVARPLWDGAQHALLSLPTPVHRMRRTALLALFQDGKYDPEDLAAFFGPQPPPKLRNRDGEDLVLCEAVYRVENERAAWKALEESLGRFEDDEDQLVLGGREVSEGEFLNRGTVTRDGRRWTVDTNSRERLEELRRLVIDASPSAVLVSESATPAADVVDEQQDAGALPDLPFGVSDDVDLPPEEQQRLVDEYMQTYEKRWLDDELPALGGRTPRDIAAEGGSALAVLEAMLDDMAWMHRQNGGGMDAARIRAHLGLGDTARGRLV